MDAPGTEGRRAHDRSTVLFGVALALLVFSVVMALLMPTAGSHAMDSPLLDLGLWVTTPASAILWVFSFQTIRTRPALGLLLVPVAYFGGMLVFLNLAMAVGRVWP